MDRPVATLAWCVVVAIGPASPHVRAAGEQAPLASISVVVTDYADVYPAILDRAQVEAGRTYRRMGVRTTWLDSKRGPAGPPADSEFAIKLIIQPRLARAKSQGSRSVMAVAPPTQSAREGSIYVFYDRVTDVAAVNRADTALLLGMVIAHEMGHLLLRHADHAAEGLMRGVWDRDAMRQGALGLLWFSPSEVVAIREALSTCCRALPISLGLRAPGAGRRAPGSDKTHAGWSGRCYDGDVFGARSPVWLSVPCESQDRSLVAGYTLLMLRALWLCSLASVTIQVATADPRSVVADRVTQLTRDTTWTRVSAVPIPFKTFHPQGLVKIGDTFFLSSVEVLDRDAGKGIGHLFKIDSAGRRLADLKLGEGAIYHPGGLDYDGTNIWVAVAEYRPNSRSIIYRVDPNTMRAVLVLRFPDHIGAMVHNTDDHTLHGVSWGSRRFYRWTLGRDGRVATVAGAAAQPPTLNPSHYVDYQDCKYAGNRRMLCTGVTEIRQSADARPFRLGGLDLVDLSDGRPLHQVPILLWTGSGLDMTHNPAWIEATATGLRAYFIPEDDNSTLYVFEATTS